VARATAALDHELPNYGELQRANISGLLRSMKSTHEAIRKLLKPGDADPTTVDALALARVQLEALYAICFMLEDPAHVDQYLRDGWKKSYIRFLLQKEECGKLPRFDDYLKNHAPKWLTALQQLFCITDEERLTIEHEELGIPLPSGAQPKKIEAFPTPSKIIGKLKDAERRKMLERLYPEYKQLSSFIHGLPHSNLFRGMFDSRSVYRNLFPEAQLKDVWQREVAEASLVLSYLSVVQASGEVIGLYPQDIDLRAAVTEAVRYLADDVLLGKAIWQIRTRRLLGALS
jgi:hypothetical protein